MGCIFLILHIVNDFGFFPEHIDYYAVEISWFMLYSPQEGWSFCFSGHIVTVRWHLRFACGGWQLGSLHCQHLILTWAASSLPRERIDQGGSRTLWRSSHTEPGAPLPPISAFLDFSPHFLELQPTLCSWSSGHGVVGFLSELQLLPHRPPGPQPTSEQSCTNGDSPYAGLSCVLTPLQNVLLVIGL